MRAGSTREGSRSTAERELELGVRIDGVLHIPAYIWCRRSMRSSRCATTPPLTVYAVEAT